MKTGWTPLPLDVVGGGVLQDHAGAQRCLEQIEVQQRRVLQHAEGPFVGVGDERDPRMLEHGSPVAAELQPRVALGPARSRRCCPARSARGRRRGAQALPVRQRLRADAAKDPAVAIEDRAVAVAVGARLELQRLGGSVMPHARSCRKAMASALPRLSARAGRGDVPREARIAVSPGPAGSLEVSGLRLKPSMETSFCQ